MKNLIFSFLFGFFSSPVMGQQYTITYQNKYLDKYSKQYEKGLISVVAIRDSVSYQYFKFPEIRVKSPLGKKFIPHSTYKNVHADKLLSQSHLFSRVKCLIVEPLPKMEWKIENIADTILNFLCNRATTEYNGKTYIAWFTTDIPIPFGPDYFGGLPGLILEIGNSETITSAVKILPQAALIVEPEVGKKMSVIEFERLKAEFYKKYAPR